MRANRSNSGTPAAGRGRGSHRSRLTAVNYLDEVISFGGLPMRRGDVIRELERLGGTPEMIGLYLMGLRPISGNRESGERSDIKSG